MLGQRWHDHKRNSQYQQQSQNQVKQIHGTLMIFAWIFLLQIGIWSHYFRYRRWSIVIHIISMVLIAVCTVTAFAIMITAQGSHVIWHNFAHQTIGFLLIMTLLPITLVYGAATKILQSWYGVNPNWIITAKQSHRLLGWLSIIFFKIPMMTGLSEDGTLFSIIVIFVDAVSYIAYWYVKTNMKTIQNILINQQNCIMLRNDNFIKSYQQYCKKYLGNHFIFANYVYDIGIVLNSHPCGQLLIDNIRDRQIDRFAYGMQVVQKLSDSTLQAHTHSAKFLQIAEKPLSKIKIHQPYLQLCQKNVFKCTQLYASRDKKMWIAYLSVNQAKIQEGYTKLEQFGRFRALQIGGITRLYSNVQFLRRDNIRFMQSIIGSEVLSKSFQKFTFSNSQNNELREMRHELQQKLVNQEQQKQNVIPIYLKKYKQGRFTSSIQSKIFQNNQPKLISQSRGFGLGLHSSYQHSRKIIIYAGGTGLNPFCDLIDILYKYNLLKQQGINTKYLQQRHPILQNRQVFDNYSFSLYLSIENIKLVHPITFFQILELSKTKLLQFHLRTMQISDDFIREYPTMHCLSLIFRFQSSIQNQLNANKQPLFLICGPGRMTKKIVQKLQFHQVNKSQYRII